MKTLIPVLTLGFLLVLSHTTLAQKQPSLSVINSTIKGINIYGKPVDNQTRCQHWHSTLDIIAIKFNCCEKYYPCFSCHGETADHEPSVWPKEEFSEKAILCGVCGTELSIQEYFDSENTCPNCNSKFNPGCSNHYHLYFETEDL